MRYWILGLLAVVFGGLAAADGDAPFDPTGHWTGAIIKEQSVLPVAITIQETQSGYRSTTLFPDWLFYRPSTQETVLLTDGGIILVDFLDGDADLKAEPRYGQLVGPVGNPEEGRSLHLKRAPPPPAPLIRSTPIKFTSADGTRLSGTLTMPTYGDKLGGMVMVRGRGCAVGLNGRAQFLARYGLAVLTYDKRGAGKSEGDCATFTHDDLTSDAIAAYRRLGSEARVDAARIGLWGESAGAWTIQAATERLRSDPNGPPPPAFLITWVGPTTSILQQQISSAVTYGEAVGLSPSQQNTLAEVSRLITDASLSDDEAFKQLSAIRSRVEAEGWLDQGFGGDDIPAVRSDMERLWLRRFRYDPAGLLGTLGDLPYLAVFGGEDPIVPLSENIAALAGKGPNVEIVTIPTAGHGYSHGEQALTLPDGTPFWLFEGAETEFTTATIRFLRKHGALQR